jgi:hypothetical protein
MNKLQDGGFVAAFECYGQAIVVKKFDEEGRELWVRELHGALPSDWSPYFGEMTIVELGNGNIALAGSSDWTGGDFKGLANHGASDVFVVMLDKQGNPKWIKSLGGSKQDDVLSITPSYDNGLLLTGGSYSRDKDIRSKYGNDSNYTRDLFVVRLQSNGSIEWVRTLGGTGDDVGTAIQTTQDGGVVVAGWTSSNNGDFSGLDMGDNDILITKLDAEGDMQWKRVYGGSLSEVPHAIDVAANGDLLVTGIACSDDGDFKRRYQGSLCVMRLSTNGSMVWKRVVSGDNCNDVGTSIATCSDDGVVLTGRALSTSGDYQGIKRDSSSDIVVIRMDKNGSVSNLTSIPTYQAPLTTDKSLVCYVHANTLTIKHDMTAKPLEVVLFNAIGEIVLRRSIQYSEMNGSTIEIDLTPYSNGLYWISLINQESHNSAQFTVVR